MARLRDFSVLQNIQTGSGTHPAFSSVSTGGSLPGFLKTWVMKPVILKIKMIFQNPVSDNV